MTKEQEFEFRYRLEQEQKAAPPATLPMPSNAAVAVNAIGKSAAAGADMVLNFPSQVNRLAGSAYTKVTGKQPHPYFATPPPDVAQRTWTDAGMIRPEHEPQTSGQKILDAGVQGATGAAMTPIGGAVRAVKPAWQAVEQFARPLLPGFLGGTVAEGTTQATGRPEAGVAASAVLPFAGRQARRLTNAPPPPNAVREATIAEGHEAGYVTPPSRVNPSLLNNVVESFAGKAAIGQQSAIKNQYTTNANAAKELGLPKGTAMTPDLLEKIRTTASEAYQKVADLPAMGPGVHAAGELSPPAALRELKQARADAKQKYDHYKKSGEPKDEAAAEAHWARAEQMETMLERHAQRAGRPELIDELHQARTRIAKTYDIEKALSEGDANVSAHTLGRSLKRGRPLSGELETTGKFAQAFPPETRNGASVPPPGVSHANTITSALLGLGGAYYSPELAVAGAVAPWLRGGVRHAVLSKPGQSLLANPRPEVSLGDTTLKSLLLARAIANRQGGAQE
jgi:hypothetical protein